jgi:hypothetical protein
MTGGGLLWLVGAASSTLACAGPASGIPVVDGTIYRGTTDPMAYRSSLPRDVPRPAGRWVEASGEACTTTISFPPNPPAVFLGSEAVLNALPYPSLYVAAGNDGYALAMARARASARGAQLFDVRADVHTTSVLGIWRRDCTEVHALAR